MVGELGLPYPVLSDPELIAIRAWGVQDEGLEFAVPATFVVDTDGRIRLSHVGESLTDRPDLDAILAALSAPGEE